ncbi:hypothetical protein DL990_32840 [Amycolatopsis sp. WAC 01416]|uniref:hypothetical protein n=1 Tax=Amycolatopsis sp. WAC 01416 TaxID=2203196 RepID=UPI000F7747C3|nr:hypothetical protein [Amycolatopsis sp. WAC 01416]RSN26209.1 hypothetical protein DL990_32840 [Amycolatopsis sp. WAC 01416]
MNAPFTHVGQDRRLHSRSAGDQAERTADRGHDRRAQDPGSSSFRCRVSTPCRSKTVKLITSTMVVSTKLHSTPGDRAARLPATIAPVSGKVGVRVR